MNQPLSDDELAIFESDIRRAYQPGGLTWMRRAERLLADLRSCRQALDLTKKAHQMVVQQLESERNVSRQKDQALRNAREALALAKAQMGGSQ
jgi:hypothetical protein